MYVIFFVQQKSAYEMRISDWSSDVCSSDLGVDAAEIEAATQRIAKAASAVRAIGVWRSDEAVKDRLKALQPLMESARIRTNLLADHANRRLAILAAQGAETAPLVYGR